MCVFLVATLCFEKKSTPEYQNTNTIPGIINRNYRISVVYAIIYIIFIQTNIHMYQFFTVLPTALHTVYRTGS